MVKDTPSDHLIDVLRKVAAGERIIDRSWPWPRWR